MRSAFRWFTFRAGAAGSEILVATGNGRHSGLLPSDYGYDVVPHNRLTGWKKDWRLRNFIRSSSGRPGDTLLLPGDALLMMSPPRTL